MASFCLQFAGNRQICIKFNRMKKGVLVLCFSITGLIHLSAQQDIAVARAMGPGATVTISGMVTSGSELGTIRYMQDQSGGIAVYSSTMSSVLRGDSITLTGVLKDYKTLLEVDPVNSVTIHSSGNLVPDPVVLTPGQFEEQVEGVLVRVEDVDFSASGEFQQSSYSFSAGGETGQVYISSANSPLIGTAIPANPVSLIGPLGSYNGTFQVLPRDLDDLISLSSIHMTGNPVMRELSTSGFTIEWSTDVDGTTEAFYGHTPGLELDAIVLPGESTSHSIEISGMNASELVYIQPFSVHEGDTAIASVQVHFTQSESGGEIRALFNRSVDPSVSLGLMEAEHVPNEMDDRLIEYIDQAEKTIDFALYNLNNSGLSNISEALNQAYDRGVVVRIVYDGDTDASGLESLDPGIGKMASPDSESLYYGIMHNKFVVFDANSTDPLRPLVWTGSTNFTYGQINTDPNNVILIQDQSLARTFRMEFNEMFGSEDEQPDPASAKFGPDKRDNTPHEFIIGGKRIECYFSPTDGTHQSILDAIGSSGHSIHVATMLISKQDIGDALALKSDQGQNVQVLLNDYDQYGEPILNTLIASLGEDVRLKGESGIMHHKYMIVDQEHAESDPLLLTGSHNWSASAEVRNDENTLIIHDQGVANAYYQEFVERFSAGKLLVSDQGPGSLHQMEDRVQVYPNPARGIIYIFTEDGIAPTGFKLIDPVGRIVKVNESEYATGVDISSLPHGLYFLHITLIGGEHITKKITIQ
jgi:phosphatidylserine/phosphatidylglycerophosphate/cardiolipin synthase-like enzyme